MPFTNNKDKRKGFPCLAVSRYIVYILPRGCREEGQSIKDNRKDSSVENYLFKQNYLFKLTIEAFGPAINDSIQP